MINLLHIFNIDVFIWLSESDNIYHAKCVFKRKIYFLQYVSFQSCNK